jgi:hypothetical protein
MPDLATPVTAQWPNVVLGMLFGRTGIIEAPDRHLWLNLVRLNDQAYHDYQRTQEAVVVVIEGHFNPISTPFIRAANCMEQCIVSTHRATRFAEVLKAKGYVPKALMPRQFERERVTKVRDSISHLEERFLSGQTNTGPSMLQMTSSKVTVAAKGGDGASLSYAELVHVLNRLRSCVDHIVEREATEAPAES